MCKIAIFPSIPDDKRDGVTTLVKELSKTMSLADRDGYGYAAVTGDGALFGERWLDNSQAFIKRTADKNILDEIINKYSLQIESLSPDNFSYNSFGAGSPIESLDQMRSIILHARMATCGKGFENTHPFVEGETALIHNGVISNTHELKNKYSTCDSEGILHEYIKNSVSNLSENIGKVASKLQGYYACAIYSKTENGTRILDVFKDDTARLRMYHIKELDLVCFATPGYTDYNSPMESACKTLGLTITKSYDLSGGQLIRFNVLSGEIIECVNFDPKYSAPKKSIVDQFTRRNKSRGVTKLDDKLEAVLTSSVEDMENDALLAEYASIIPYRGRGSY